MARVIAKKSDRGKLRRVVVVGSGVAGLAATLRLCESGVPVLLISLASASRAASATIQSGVSAALESSGGEGEVHVAETLESGGRLAHEAPVKSLVAAAPNILNRLARMGVAFERTAEGRVAQFGSDGTARERTAYVGASTGVHVARALAEQVLRWGATEVADEHGVEVPGETMVQRLEGWDVLELVLDDNGVAVGVVAQELQTLRIKAYGGDAVCLATGGVGSVFARSTVGPKLTGSAAFAAFRQGAAVANLDLLHVHPTAFPAADKARIVGERLRALGGRVWFPRDARDKRPGVEIPEKERDYVLERRFTELGNLASGKDAASALVSAFVDKGRGIFDSESGESQPLAYLDVSHLRRSDLAATVGPLLEAMSRLSGTDAFVQPIRVGPAPCGSHGGLWVDFETDSTGDIIEDSPRSHATTIPGLYAAGDVEYQYDGACRLEGNALIRLIHAGQMAACGMTAYQGALARSALDLPTSVFDSAENAAEDAFRERRDTGKDGESAYALHAELGEAMSSDCGLRRDEASLAELVNTLADLDERAQSAACPDSSSGLNPQASFLRQLQAMTGIARLMAQSAQARLADDTPRTLLMTADDGGGRMVEELEYFCAGRPVAVSSRILSGRLSTSSGERGSDGD